MAKSVSRTIQSPGKSSFQKIGVLAKADSKISMECLKKLLPTLKKYNDQNSSSKTYLDKALRSEVSAPSSFIFADITTMAASCDLLLSVGGDGTLLRAARLLLDCNGWKTSSLLGINTGRLGFLTFLGANEAESGLKEILMSHKVFDFETRGCLQVQILRMKKVLHTFDVLNDCVLKNGALSRLIEYQVSMNNEFLSAYRADGLIISTPTGSTAYNLAAGGAILEPQIPAIQLTPICAQSFSNKTIVVSDSNTISLALGGPAADTYLTLDGHTSIKLELQDRIEIRKSAKSVALLLPPNVGPTHYIHSLRQKLKWGLVSPSSP